MGSLKDVKAMMMAAGEGTRLRPLTHALPKPMVPVANKPVMELTLENAARHGLREIAVNLYHRPEVVKDYFGDGSRWGFDLRYSVESKLMGTAGGVKRMESFLGTGTFIILSGDGLSEIDLSAAVAFHRRRKSLATMVLKRVSSKFEYGVTLTDSTGRIKQFFEKPSWSDIFTDTVNTGVYIFEPEIFRHIPADTVYDFGKQVWPFLLKSRKPIFGFLSDDYWCDIGNLAEYRRGQRDVLEGRLKHVALEGRLLRGNIRVGKGTTISSRARISGPCIIGRNVKIAAGAVVGPLTVIGNDVSVGAGATVQESTLWDGVSLGEKVYLQDSIVARGVRVKDRAVFSGGILVSASELPRG